MLLYATFASHYVFFFAWDWLTVEVIIPNPVLV